MDSFFAGVAVGLATGVVLLVVRWVCSMIGHAPDLDQ